MRPEALPILKEVYKVRFDGLRIVPNENADASPKLKRFDPVPVALAHAMLRSLDSEAFQSELDYLFQEGLVRSANSRSTAPIGCYMAPDGRKIELLLEQIDKPSKCDRLLNGQYLGCYTGEQYMALIDGTTVYKEPACVVNAMGELRLKRGETRHYANDRPRIVEYIELTKAGSMEIEGSREKDTESRVEPEPAPKKRGGTKGRRIVDIKQEQRIADAWDTNAYKTHEELAKALDMSKRSVDLALDRHRKR